MDKKITVKSITNTYNGNVKITLLNGEKPYRVINKHNYGTTKFFKYMWRRVRGDVLNTKVPAYIFACGNGGRLTNYGVVTEGTPSITPTDDSTNDNKSTLTYTFLIPGTIVKGDTITGFELVSLDLEDTYAVLELDNNSTITIESTKTNILVEWSLVLSNGGEI